MRGLLQWLHALLMRGHPMKAATGRTWFPDAETRELLEARASNRQTRAEAEGMLKELEHYRHFLERALLRVQEQGPETQPQEQQQ